MLLPFLVSASLAAPPAAGLAAPTGGATEPPVFAPDAPVGPAPAPVVGGAPAPPGKWPDAVAIFSAGGSFACTGVLIAPDVVLTAGHCQFMLESALVGTNDLRDGSGDEVAVVEVIGHEDYTSTFDVALARLERPITSVAPRLLALDCVIEDYLVDGATVTVAGFGATDENASVWTSALNEALTTVRDADCSDLASGCYSAVSPGGEVSAGGDGVDSCVGDSGGPLYLDTPQGQFLLGTTSRALIPADTACGDGGIYVRADAVVGWIEEQLGYPLERPACDGWNGVPHPLADPIEVPAGGVGATLIDPGDDEGELHTFEVIEAPVHGRAEVYGDGGVLYTAPFWFHGEDRVVVRVTDDGEPQLAGELEIQITVGADGALRVAPGGCATAPGPGAVGLVGLLALRARRRR